MQKKCFGTFAMGFYHQSPPQVELGGVGISSLRTLRSMRSLRPLRTIQRLPGIRLVVNVLFECAPVFINICFVVLFVFFVFAIMGVQFFAGLFWACNDGSVQKKPSFSSSYEFRVAGAVSAGVVCDKNMCQTNHAPPSHPLSQCTLH